MSTQDTREILSVLLIKARSFKHKSLQNIFSVISIFFLFPVPSFIFAVTILSFLMLIISMIALAFSHSIKALSDNILIDFTPSNRILTKHKITQDDITKRIWVFFTLENILLFKDHQNVAYFTSNILEQVFFSMPPLPSILTGSIFYFL